MGKSQRLSWAWERWNRCTDSQLCYEFITDWKPNKFVVGRLFILFRFRLYPSQVDFIWVNRDQKCFEWFVGILAQLEVEQAEEGCFENFLDLHLYMTSAVSKNDMKGLCLQLALERMYMKKKKDLVTGLRTRTKPGRPDWGKVKIGPRTMYYLNVLQKSHIVSSCIKFLSFQLKL